MAKTKAKKKIAQVGDRVSTPAKLWGTVTSNTYSSLKPYVIQWDGLGEGYYSESEFKLNHYTVHPPEPTVEDIEEEELNLWDIAPSFYPTNTELKSKRGEEGRIIAIDPTKRVPYCVVWESGNSSWYATEKVEEWRSLWMSSLAESADSVKPPTSPEASPSETTLTVTPTPKLSTDTITQMSLFTETSEIITQTGDLKSTPLDSPVLEHRAPALELDLITKNPAYGLKPCDASSRGVQTLSLLKTLKVSSIADFERYLEDSEWQDTVGTIRNSYRLRRSVLHIEGTESSLLPTPTTYPKSSGKGGDAGTNKLEKTLKLLPITGGNRLERSLLPTPVARDGKGRSGTPGESLCEPIQEYLTGTDKMNSRVPGWMMGFQDGYAEEILMDGGETTQPQNIQVSQLERKDAEPASKSTDELSSLSKPRSLSGESSTSTTSTEETWIEHILVVGDRSHPWQLPTVEACEVVNETPKKVNATDSQGKKIQKFKDKVWYLPRREYWQQFQSLTKRLQVALDTLANALRQRGNYQAKLQETGGYKQAPNPLCPWVISTEDPDSDAPAYWYSDFSIPHINRHRIEKHTPQKLNLAGDGDWQGRLTDQSGCFVCPTDEDWEEVRSLHEEAIGIQKLIEEYLEFLGTYDKAETQWANPRKYVESLGEGYLQKFEVSGNEQSNRVNPAATSATEDAGTTDPIDSSEDQATEDEVGRAPESEIDSEDAGDLQAFRVGDRLVHERHPGVILVVTPLPSGDIFGRQGGIKKTVRVTKVDGSAFENGADWDWIPVSKAQRLEPTAAMGEVQPLRVGDRVCHPNLGEGIIVSINEPASLWWSEDCDGTDSLITPDFPLVLWENGTHRPVSGNALNLLAHVEDCLLLPGEETIPSKATRIGCLKGELEAIAHRTGSWWSKKRQQLARQIQSLSASLNMPVTIKQPGQQEIEATAQVDLGSDFLVEAPTDALICPKLYAYPREPVVALAPTSKPLATIRSRPSANGETYEVLRIEGTDAVVLIDGDCPQRLPLDWLELNEEAIALLSDDQLTAAIKANHDACEGHFKQAMSSLNAALWRAKQAGQMLGRKKKNLGHGGWLPWLSESGIKERSAQVYKRVSENWDKIVESAAAAGLSLDQLTLEGALKLIAKTKEPKAIEPQDEEVIEVEATESLQPEEEVPPPKTISTEEVVKELAIGLRSLPTKGLESLLETVKPLTLVKAVARVSPETLIECGDEDLEAIAANAQALLRQAKRLLKERQSQDRRAS